MKYVKKFEELDFSKGLPITTENFLTNYYHCDSCNVLWKSLNRVDKICKFCEGDDIEDLSEDEWYEIVRSRLDEDEIENLDLERLKSQENFLDLSDPNIYNEN